MRDVALRIEGSALAAVRGCLAVHHDNSFRQIVCRMCYLASGSHCSRHLLCHQTLLRTTTSKLERPHLQTRSGGSAPAKKLESKYDLLTSAVRCATTCGGLQHRVSSISRLSRFGTTDIPLLPKRVRIAEMVCVCVCARWQDPENVATWKSRLQHPGGWLSVWSCTTS